LGWNDTTRSKETPKQPESEGPDMPRSDHPTYNWPTQRHYLNEAMKHLSAFTDNIATFLELGNEAEAQVLNLDFGTTSVLQILDDLETEETSMAKGETRIMTSRHDAPNIRKTWTNEERQLVLAGLKLGLKQHEIGKKLGRTEHAIARELFRIRKAGEL